MYVVENILKLYAKKQKRHGKSGLPCTVLILLRKLFYNADE